MERFPKAFGLQSLGPFLRVSEQGLCLTAMGDGGDKIFVQLELACEAAAAAPPVPVSSGHRCHC